MVADPSQSTTFLDSAGGTSNVPAALGQRRGNPGHPPIQPQMITQKEFLRLIQSNTAAFAEMIKDPRWGACSDCAEEWRKIQDKFAAFLRLAAGQTDRANQVLSEIETYVKVNFERQTRHADE